MVAREVVMHMSNDQALQEENDITFVELREDERSIVGMQGRYSLKSWRDASGGSREFSCCVTRMSSGVIEIAGSVTGSIGEWAVAHFDRFGKFEGPVIRIVERGFAMRIVATAEDRNRIARKIEWTENKKSSDKRQHERFVPRNPHSTLYLPNGHFMPCQIIDYSMSGAAVSSEISPEIGTILLVGKIIGQVMRRFPEGFAFEFRAIRSLRTVDELFTKAEDKS
jgi:hypothetical protein